MTTVDMRRCWAPVEKHWRLVQPGDVTVGADGDLIPITGIRPDRGEIRVEFTLRGTDGHVAFVEADGLVDVLVPAVERDGLALLAEELGGRLIA